MTEREARERAALAAEAVRGRKAAASARQAQDQVERLTTQMLSLKEEVARLGSQIEAANERHEAALTEITGLSTELRQTRDRLHVVYNLKWNQLGQLLREVRQRPVRILKLPVRAVRLLRNDTTGYRANAVASGRGPPVDRGSTPRR